MEKEKAIHANALVEEIKDLERYKEMLKNSEYKNVVHFQIEQHYGKNESWEYISIDRRHNVILFHLIDQIIENLESELAKI